MTDGVLVIDKPRGPTSHDIVARIRRVLRIREVGHAGTLDPMATGVLLVAVGEATKLVPWLTAQDKVYRATIALGVETDTLDAWGREVRELAPGDELRRALASSSPGQEISPMIRAALAAESARSTQMPPSFSAIKSEGERAYARARRGERPVLSAREVHVRSLELVACCEAPASLDVAIEVGKGYYVRALARDLAAALGTVGHLTSLRRTRSGGFACGEALPPDAPSQELLARMHPLSRAAARALPVSHLTEAGAHDARHGRPVRFSEIRAPTRDTSAWLDPHGNLVAVGAIDEGGLGRVTRGFGT
jgi:tRNA pseudouridine55 synthase